MLGPTKTICLHRIQQAFRRSNAPFRGFVGGRGAGKSWIGAYDLLRRAEKGRLYMALAPTFPMLQDASWRALVGMAQELRFLKAINRSDLRLTLGNGAEILGRSADNPERLRGPNLSGVWMDEASQVDEAAYGVVIACLREGGQQGWLSATFTPRGKTHWTYRVFAEGGPGVALFRARTTQNPFLPESFYQTVRGQYTSSLASQELEGEFVDPDGGLFQRAWFRTVEAAPTGFGTVSCRHWDLAATEGDGDYTVGVKIVRATDGTFCIVDVVRGQWSPSKRDTVILETARRDGPAVNVGIEEEPGSAGKHQSEHLIRLLAGFSVKAVRPSGPKEVRARPLAAQMEAGNVTLLRSPWNGALVDEFCSFPGGAHDDQVDAAAGAFNALTLGLFDWTGQEEARDDNRSLVSQAPPGVFLT